MRSAMLYGLRRAHGISQGDMAAKYPSHSERTAADTAGGIITSQSWHCLTGSIKRDRRTK